MKLARGPEGYATVLQIADPSGYEAADDLLETVFEDGASFRTEDLATIRARVSAQDGDWTP